MTNATPQREIGNAITHGLGTVLSVPALIILIIMARTHGDAWYVVSYAIFGSSMLFLYLASTLYHATTSPKPKRTLEKLDHIGVFVLIAGSYTAFSLTILRNSVGWWVFGAVWAIAIFGSVIESLFLNRWPLATLGAYLAMGWLIILVWKQLSTVGSASMLTFLLAGGACYTIGTIFYSLGRRWGGFHIAWHLLVIAGTVCHFFSALAALPAQV
ncbi:MAG: hemolysin III family protein [Spirochaetia bacterium]|jgi:hemolysin III|nr:hemolysin III family protein [Spirochaetia bacterium]